MSNFKSRHSSITFFVSVLLFGCINTEGDLVISGYIRDEYTNSAVPFRHVIVQGLKESNQKFTSFEVGQFSTDSSGRFNYTLEKVKDILYYNFILVGDSNYAFITKRLGLYELEQNANSIYFSMSRLANLSIGIIRKSKKPDFDTLSLAWTSNDVFFWSLFPYKIYTYDRSNKYIAVPGKELRWYGGNVNSIVKTRVYADKKTKIYWDLDRYGKRSQFIDTITCKRNINNKIYFSY